MNTPFSPHSASLGRSATAPGIVAGDILVGNEFKAVARGDYENLFWGPSHAGEPLTHIVEA